MSKELIAATVRELEGWPGASMTQEPQGKHGKLVLHFNQQSRLVVIASTPGDCRAVPNHIAVVRRELRGMGASKAHAVVGDAKAPEQKIMRRIPDVAPATQKPFQALDKVMAQPKKIEAIFTTIEDLKYGEMLKFAELLSGAALATNLKRKDVHGWARMLQTANERKDYV